jgi:hypothetical protein
MSVLDSPVMPRKNAAARPRCGNCRHGGHAMRDCPRPRRTSFRRTVCVPGTPIALLSRPSKMPGASWSLPAGPSCPFALYGPNTICGSCFAQAGNYRADPNVVRAQAARFAWTRDCLKTPDGTDHFVETMVAAIAAAAAGPYMRVHDSGDLFSPAYTRAWIRICSALPSVRFWFPTRSWRAPWVGVIQQLAALPNVTVRPSALHFDSPPPVVAGLAGGTTAAAEGFTCPAPRNHNACGDCRACWIEPNTPISYHAHFVGRAA